LNAHCAVSIDRGRDKAVVPGVDHRRAETQTKIFVGAVDVEGIVDHVMGANRQGSLDVASFVGEKSIVVADDRQGVAGL
jgi:hypothetical protein